MRNKFSKYLLLVIPFLFSLNILAGGPEEVKFIDEYKRGADQTLCDEVLIKLRIKYESESDLKSFTDFAVTFLENYKNDTSEFYKIINAKFFIFVKDILIFHAGHHDDSQFYEYYKIKSKSSLNQALSSDNRLVGLINQVLGLIKAHDINVSYPFLTMQQISGDYLKFILAKYNNRSSMNVDNFIDESDPLNTTTIGSKEALIKMLKRHQYNTANGSRSHGYYSLPAVVQIYEYAIEYRIPIQQLLSYPDFVEGVLKAVESSNVVTRTPGMSKKLKEISEHLSYAIPFGKQEPRKMSKEYVLSLLRRANGLDPDSKLPSLMPVELYKYLISYGYSIGELPLFRFRLEIIKEIYNSSRYNLDHYKELTEALNLEYLRAIYENQNPIKFLSEFQSSLDSKVTIKIKLEDLLHFLKILEFKDEISAQELRTLNLLMTHQDKIWSTLKYYSGSELVSYLATLIYLEERINNKFSKKYTTFLVYRIANLTLKALFTREPTESFSDIYYFYSLIYKDYVLQSTRSARNQLNIFHAFINIMQAASKGIYKAEVFERLNAWVDEVSPLIPSNVARYFKDALTTANQNPFANLPELVDFKDLDPNALETWQRVATDPGNADRIVKEALRVIKIEERATNPALIGVEHKTAERVDPKIQNFMHFLNKILQILNDKLNDDTPQAIITYNYINKKINEEYPNEQIPEKLKDVANQIIENLKQKPTGAGQGYQVFSVYDLTNEEFISVKLPATKEACLLNEDLVFHGQGQHVSLLIPKLEEIYTNINTTPKGKGLYFASQKDLILNEVRRALAHAAAIRR